MTDPRIPAHTRALALWARCWQLAGGRWPPLSRAITRRCIIMVSNYLLDVSEGQLTEEEALERAWEAMAPLTAQRFYPGGEQDIAVERLAEAILDAEIGPLP